MVQINTEALPPPPVHAEPLRANTGGASTKRHRRKMHVNSLEAYYCGLVKGVFNAREVAILGSLKRLLVATDREIQIELGFKELARVQPRISDLIKRGVLIQVGVCESPETGISVRKVSIAPRAPTRFEQMPLL